MRTALWRINLCLTLGVGALALGLLSGQRPPDDLIARDWDTEVAPLSVSRNYMPKRGERFEDFLPVYRHFYPAAPKRQIAAAPTGPTKLPLQGFEITQVWYHPDDGHFLMLDSKDPAFDEQVFLREGEPNGDTRIVSIRRGPKRLFVRIQRGKEDFEFSTPHHFEYSVAGVTLATVGSTPNGASSAPGAAGATSGVSRVAIKGVPFYEKGIVVGLRLTGLHPKSWAHEYGLRRGDIVRSIDGKGVRFSANASSRLREAPAEMEIVRISGDERRIISLSQS